MAAIRGFTEHLRVLGGRLLPWRVPTYSEFIAELVRLKLKGVEFDAEEYARRLAWYMGVRIEVVSISEMLASRELPLTAWEAKLVEKSMVDNDLLGEARWYAGWDPPTYIVIVADDLGWFLRQATIFHELGHLAAGHHFKDGSIAGVRKLADGKPPRNKKQREEEADIRGDYAVAAGNLGKRSLEKDSLNNFY